MTNKLQKLYLNTKQNGSTIIELLIATAIVGAVITAVAIALTYSIKNNAEVRYREAATTLAQQGMEMFRRERERQNWGTFYTNLDAGTHCLNTLPASVVASTFAAGDNSCAATATFTFARNAFQREVIISKPDAINEDEIQLVVSVYWNLGTSDEKSVSVTHRMKERLN